MNRFAEWYAVDAVLQNFGAFGPQISHKSRNFLLKNSKQRAENFQQTSKFVFQKFMKRKLLSDALFDEVLRNFDGFSSLNSA